MFDEKLEVLLEKLREDDLLIITADHGNDPPIQELTTQEKRYLSLPMERVMEGNGMLPEQDTFAVIGATIVDNFGLHSRKNNHRNFIAFLFKIKNIDKGGTKK